MKAVLNNLAINNTRGKRDLIGILLALVVGISGQIFMLNPIRILTPKLPMLSHRVWPHSHIVQGPLVTYNTPNWREFYIRMEIPKKSVYELNSKAFLWQKTSWYADATKPPQAMAYDLAFDYYNEQPIAESSLSKDKPASKLFCQDDGYVYSCKYLAYTDHWYTQVVMVSQGDEYFSASEMQQIVNRVDQLLLEAPDKP